MMSIARHLTRRNWFSRTTSFLGGLAVAGLSARDAHPNALAGAYPGLHHPARARRVIFLFQSGGPSQMDLFDPKPKLTEMHGKEIPPSVRGSQTISNQTRFQAKLPLVGSPFRFRKHGQSGMELSDLLPHTAGIADEITLIRSLVTEPFNHDPAAMFWFTGSQRAGRPSVGAWISYGLGSANQNLPEYVVLLSGDGGQSLQSNYWGSGFLPTRHQATQFRSAADPILYAANPPGIDVESRRRTIAGLNKLNRAHLEEVGDPEILTRIHSYEQAGRLQTVVPELTNLANEPKSVLEMYGAEPGKPSYANNCLLARRLVERGVRFVQLCHRDWDQHTHLKKLLPEKCMATDRASAALVNDLKGRGLLDDTLVVWGGEFGRTAFSQGELVEESYGRDHHPYCFSMWLAGGGFKSGFAYGRTDDFSYNIAENPVHVHDLHATILHVLGVDHTRLTFKHQGRDFRLTDVAGKVVRELLT
jgi:Protein of unknown function (DUF1501)